MLMRLLTWNVQRLKAERAAYRDVLLEHNATIICLQECNRGERFNELTGLMAARGYRFCCFGEGTDPFVTAIFARVACIEEAAPSGLLRGAFWVEARAGQFGITGIHIPIPSLKLDREAYWAAINDKSRENHNRHHVILGDFNATHREVDAQGRKVAGAQNLDLLEEMGWIDAWRHINGKKREYSWYYQERLGFRVDQAWLSPGLANALKNAWFDHLPREKGLSDHSALIVDLDEHVLGEQTPS